MDSSSAGSRSPATLWERILSALALLLLAAPLATPLWSSPTDTFRAVSGASLLLLLAALAFSYRRHDLRGFSSLVANMRWLRIVHYCFMLSFGALLYYHVTAQPIAISASDLPRLAAGYLAVIFAWLAAVNLNDIYDLPSDRVQGLKRPLVTGELGLNTFWWVSGVYLAFSAAFALLVHLPFFLLNVAGLALAYLYSAPPLRLKRRPFVATFVLASCNLLLTLMGYSLMAPGQLFAHYPPRVMIMILLIFTLANNSKDLRDLEGDRAMSVVTLPALLGSRWSKPVIGLMTAASYLIVPPFLGLPILYPLAFLGAGLSYHLINREPLQELPLFLSYFTFFIGVVIAIIAALPS